MKTKTEEKKKSKQTWKLEFVWKHKSCLDLQIKIMARLILL